MAEEHSKKKLLIHGSQEIGQGNNDVQEGSGIIDSTENHTSITHPELCIINPLGGSSTKQVDIIKLNDHSGLGVWASLCRDNLSSKWWCWPWVT